MSYNDFEKDFPRHTIEILEKYFSKEPHNVTLLINCMVGLLILPQEKFFKNNTFLKKLPEEIPPDWGLTREHVKQVQCSARGYKLENIVRHMRNAVAHMKIKTIPRSNNEIEKITFKDISNFELEIPVADLKTFIIKLSQHIIECQ